MTSSSLIKIKSIPTAAVTIPEASFGGQYLHAEIFKMADAYLYHLVMNHPFVDGNKRGGLESGDAFEDY